MKLISYSLFGDQKIYKHGLLKNIELAKKLLPEWKLRIYICSTVDKNFIDKCKCPNTEVIVKSKVFKHEQWLWRFLPMEEDHDVVIVRDVDTRIFQRDINLINDWLKTDFKFHVVRENLGSHWPIMAGIWGGKNPNLKISNYYKKWIKNKVKNMHHINDQTFLARYIYPQIRENLAVYSKHVVMDCEKNIKEIPGKEEYYKGKKIMIGMPVIDDFFEEDKNNHPEYFNQHGINKFEERLDHWNSKEEEIVPSKPLIYTPFYKYENYFINIFMLLIDMIFRKKLNIFKILYIFFVNKILSKFINIRYLKHNLDKYYK